MRGGGGGGAVYFFSFLTVWTFVCFRHSLGVDGILPWLQ